MALKDLLPELLKLNREEIVEAIDILQRQASLSDKPQEVNEDIVTNPAREAARAKLLAARALSTAHRAPDSVQSLSAEEQRRVWQLFSQGRSSDELVDEDRGTY